MRTTKGAARTQAKKRLFKKVKGFSRWPRQAAAYGQGIVGSRRRIRVPRSPRPQARFSPLVDYPHQRRCSRARTALQRIHQRPGKGQDLARSQIAFGNGHRRSGRFRRRCRRGQGSVAGCLSRDAAARRANHALLTSSAVPRSTTMAPTVNPCAPVVSGRHPPNPLSLFWSARYAAVWIFDLQLGGWLRWHWLNFWPNSMRCSTTRKTHSRPPRTRRCSRRRASSFLCRKRPLEGRAKKGSAVDKTEKPAAGKRLNEVKEALETAFTAAELRVKDSAGQAARPARRGGPRFDPTPAWPGRASGPPAPDHANDRAFERDYGPLGLYAPRADPRSRTSGTTFRR